MATIVVDDERNGGNRPMHLYIVVSQRTGIPPMDVRDRIIGLANVKA